MQAYGDGWVLVGPAAFKAVVRRAERLGCVRFAHVSAKSNRAALPGRRFAFSTKKNSPLFTLESLEPVLMLPEIRKN